MALGVHDVTHDGAAKLKTDAHRTASGTQGRLRGALTSQEIAKYVEHCLKPGKVPGPDKCSNELLKRTSAPMSS